MHFRTRHRVEEWMDRPDVDPRALDLSLRFLQRVNRWLGYTHTTIAHLDRFSRSWKRGQTYHLIDFATGSADIPRAILRWADAKKLDVRIVGVDRHAATARVAAEQAQDPRLTIVQADVLELPFEAGSFDYALSAMFLHHLDDTSAARVLQNMDRLARRGIILADLIRNRRAYAWSKVLTAFSPPIIRHDAPASVAQAFTRDEILALRDRAGLGYAQYRVHFGHRFVLSGEKS